MFRDICGSPAGLNSQRATPRLSGWNARARQGSGVTKRSKVVIMEFAQAEVWGKSNPAKDQKECLGPSNYPNHKKCSNICWKDSASPKELIDIEFREQLSKSHSVSSLGKEISSSQRCLHLSSYLLSFSSFEHCAFFVFHKRIFRLPLSFGFFLLYFNLILRPTRETQRALLDFAEFRFASSIREIILGESPLQIF